MKHRSFAGLLLSGIAMLAAPMAAYAASGEGASAPADLKVCADPNYLPFSNKAGEGFENKVAEIVAKAMGRKLTYVWASERGEGGFGNFLADNLDAGKCDVVMSLPYGDGEDGYTDPYYESAYVFVTRKDEPKTVIKMSSPALHSMKIGVLDDTTPVQALKILGLVDNAVGFDVAENPNTSPRDLLDAVKSHKVDVVVTWQPAIGGFLKDYPGLQTREVPPEEYGPGLPQVTYAYKISMGIRKDDTPLKTALNAVIKSHKSELDQALTSNGVKFYSGHVGTADY